MSTTLMITRKKSESNTRPIIGRTGGLWRLDLRDPQANPVRLLEAPADFHPCGLSLLRTGDNTRLMFVVNRRAISDPTVEIFAVSEEGLRHEETICGGDALTSPNDIAATGPASFYVTWPRSSSRR